MSLSTSVTQAFGIEVPVIGAPMIGVAGPALARAVSGAGGLGMVGISPVADLAAVEGELEALVADGVTFGVGLLAWSLANRPDLVDLAIRVRPALISLSFGDYAEAGGQVRDAGIPLTTQVGTVADAVQTAPQVDILVVRGGEGGGHGLDRVATLPLLQRVLDVVDVPVVAAGGIAGARSLAAVLAAGAAGAWVGTALLASTEGENSGPGQDRVIAAAETDTVYTTAYDRALGLPWPEGVGGRMLRNRFTDSWAEREAEVSPGSQATEELRDAFRRNDIDGQAVWAGQAVGSVQARRSATEVVAEMASGAEALLRRWG